MSEPDPTTTETDVAIIGMSCRFAGAPDPETYWQRICEGRELLTRFTEEDLAAAGTSRELLDDPAFVRVSSLIEGAGAFDADFWGISSSEAALIDPQHRLLLELSWHALEDAGYDPSRHPGDIGVFAGGGRHAYLRYIEPDFRATEHLDGSIRGLQSDLGNYGDFLATRVSYKLGLTGPALNVQTACSTGLVAVHLACQSLLLGESDIALAGAVNVHTPQVNGYVYEEGSICSPDGHLRPFDADASGSVFGNGGGVVALKRLSDALRDNDRVVAVIKGSAINNDGADKMSFTAPSISGQADVIRRALQAAGVEPGGIGFVETHGTGTAMGDPIEVAALTAAYGTDTAARRCALGAVKAQIGHLGNSAGIAGLIKAALVLEHGVIPPVVNFSTLNPAIDLTGSPFYVPVDSEPFEGVRRAGVSAFGVGGTNAHAVLEQAPPAAARRAAEQPAPTARPLPFVLSARSAEGVAALRRAHGTALRPAAAPDAVDAAYVLATGRKGFRYRTFTVAATAAEAARALAASAEPPVVSAGTDLPVVFALPGEGAQFVGLGRELYAADPDYRRHVDACARVLEELEGYDIRDLLFPDAEDPAATERATTLLAQAPWAQPATFITEFSVARTLMEAGVVPDVLVGHSLGEYAAACLAGVFSVRDALRVVSARGRLMQFSTPDGAMAAVGLDEEELLRLLPDDLDLAGVNAVGQCVVSGTAEAIGRFQERLDEEDIRNTRLATSNAAHSRLMDGIAAEYRELVASVEKNKAGLRIVSTVTGREIAAEEMTDTEYWLRHLRSPVRFRAAALTVLEGGHAVVLETGPGRALTRMFENSGSPVGSYGVTPWLKDQPGPGSTAELVARIWAHGGRVDWERYFAGLAPARVALPGYPFERNDYWIDVDPAAVPADLPELRRSAGLTGWLQAPRWTAAPLPVEPAAVRRVLLTGAASPAALTDAVAGALAAAGHHVVRHDGPALPPDAVDTVVHLAAGPRSEPAAGTLGTAVDTHFWPLLETVRDLTARPGTQDLDVLVVTSARHAVLPGDLADPYAALLTGPSRVLPQEYPTVRLAELDLADLHGPGAAGDLSGPGTAAEAADLVTAELGHFVPNSVAAHRAGVRHVRDYRALPSLTAPPPWHEDGSYLVTGGLGEIGLALAADAARHARVRLVLTHRSEFPAPEDWARAAQDPATGADTRRRLETLLEIAAGGSEVVCARADVTDRDAMARLRALHGPFHGVIHAAGVPSGRLAGTLDREHADAVLAPKVRGTVVLHEAVADEHTEWMVLCSSMAAVVGGLGHADYASANAFMDAFAQWRDAGGHRTVSANFDSWTDGGMAVKEAEKRHTAPTGDTERWEPLDHPLFTARAAAGAAYRGAMARGTHWILDEHRVGGTPLVPGTAILDLLGAAAELHLGHDRFALTELDLLRPLTGSGGRVEYTVRFVTADDGTDGPDGPDGAPDPAGAQDGSAGVVTVTVSGLAPDGSWYQQAVGRLEPLERSPESPESAEAPEHATGAEPSEPAADAADTPPAARSDLLTFGPRWDNLRAVRRVGPDEVEAVCVLDDAFRADLDTHRVHAALLDTAAGAMVPLVSDRVHLPLSYERVVVHSRMPHHVVSRITRRDSDESDALVFDVAVRDAGGRPVLDIEGYTLRAVDPARLADELADDPGGEGAARPQNRRLVTTDPGDLSALGMVPAARRAPGPGEIEIEVRATGLNFKEVLIAAGMLDAPTADHSFGLECAGLVTAVGEGVGRQVRVGDAVMGVGASCFADYAVLKAALTCPIPAGMTFSQAASIPVAFTTAYDSLIASAGLGRGERILIHAGAGGVGLAALQLATHAGAEVWATAGNETKRDFLRNLGATLVADSRSLDFEAAVTGAGGVDVLLNSLAGDFIPAGLRCLRPRGRFVEIGRRDILAGTALDLSLFAEGRTFTAYNPEIDGDAWERAWRQVVGLLRQGAITPLPVRTFPVEEADEAFAFMSRAHHIGKVVVARPGAQEPAAPTGSADATGEVQGLTTAVGVRTFLDALGAGVPQVLVSRRSVAAAGGQLVVAGHVLQETGGSRTSARPDLPYPYEPPQTETEERLGGLWGALLTIDPVGRHDRFLDLGGDSLYATQMVARIRKVFGVRVAPADILGGLDLAGLADAIDRQVDTALEQR
ncbi:putative polyketide synthase [Actinacidiphila reveromycinica]|uniref:Putative polyketide synthase n=1 Tax=Actinacidiphila reveromycinica TaxID=659352 RepID=A0A7U3VSJ0_9ACTN|nr:type I polyketide synthase [Streptomyces sp. SN-593]BBB01931.1 putative polyketide synthase [Streptomyces sp. SN-593]